MPSEHQRFISVIGATEHNLKNVDVRIPGNALTVITGISGSGKSALAFDLQNGRQAPARRPPEPVPVLRRSLNIGDIHRKEDCCMSVRDVAFGDE